jgi:quercetin dioxygenase-like cupin family protein
MSAQLVNLHLTDGDARQSVYETDDIQIMRVRLAAGDFLPPHNANANALLIPLQGAVTVTVAGVATTARAGEGVSVPYQTRMDVSNQGAVPLTFLVLKTPHPKTFK